MILRRLSLRVIALLAGAVLVQSAVGADALAAPSQDPSSSPAATSPAPAGGDSGSGQTAPGSSNAIFGLQPASATSTDGRPYFTYSATPGGRINDHVAVVNIGADALPLSVYATDATSSADGDITFLTEDQKAVAAGAWVALNAGPQPMTVPGRPDVSAPPSTVILPFTVNVPASATPGDHVAAVIASLQTTKTNADGSTVNLDQRVAMRIYLRISGDVSPKLSIEKLRVSYHGTMSPFGSGTATVTYRVRNAGDVLLGAGQSVSVKGLIGGTHDAAAAADVPSLLPGASVDVKVLVKGIWPGIRLTATVHLTPHYDVSSDSKTNLPRVTGTATSWAMPWILLAILVVIAAAIVLRVRSRRGRPAAKPGHRVVAAAGAKS